MMEAASSPETEHPTEQSRMLQEIYAWWNKLQQDPGKRAGLKRCQTLTQVFFEAGYYDLYRSLRGTKWRNRLAVAALAGMLAHVKTDSQLKFIQSLASPKSGDAPRVSKLRFRRLLVSKSEEEFEREFYPDLLRILALIDNSVNIADFAEQIYQVYVYKPFKADSNSDLFQKWAFEYYSLTLK